MHLCCVKEPATTRKPFVSAEEWCVGLRTSEGLENS